MRISERTTLTLKNFVENTARPVGGKYSSSRRQLTVAAYTNFPVAAYTNFRGIWNRPGCPNLCRFSAVAPGKVQGGRMMM
jgi:hypothetical protein